MMDMNMGSMGSMGNMGSTGNMGGSAGSGGMGMQGMPNNYSIQGYGAVGSHQGEMVYTNGSGGFITSLLGMLTQVLFVALIVILVVGLVVWLKNNYLKESFAKASSKVSGDPYLKTISVLVLTLLSAIVVFYLLGFLLSGGFSTQGFFTAITVAGLLTFFIKLLTVLFVIALIGFTLSYAKKNLIDIQITKPDQHE
ncbi:MAG TPA: hypothetical protein VEA58_13085 [Anaerovoracaceae bacterium]|nr:hypothetical protein [Anaerovoracaceae bacterium]